MSGQYVYANPSIGIQAFRDPRQAYAQALMANGSSTAPVHSWGEALARALQAPLGGYMQAKTFQGYQQQDEAYRTKLAAALKSPDPISAIQTSDDPTLQNMGLEHCLAATHPRTYEPRRCETCQTDDAYFDPAFPRRTMCVDCHQRQQLRRED